MLDHYEYFKSEVYKLTKIDLNCYKEKQMRRRIDTLATKNKAGSYEEYIEMLKSNHDLFDQFVNFLTINVSEFYRNPDQWELLDKTVIPKLIADHGKTLKIWSAACSTGDEPYSLVMAFSKHIPLSNIQIIATDIDKQVLAAAQMGLYNEKSIANVPEEFKKKYFTPVGKSNYQINDEIKKCVEFKVGNLLSDKYPTDMDLIVCRNVVIYFTDEAKTEIYKKFNASLKTGAYLFVGSTEQIINYKELNYTSFKSFFYKKN